MRALGGWQPDAYARVLAWPLREALLAYEELLRAEARAEYSRALLRHAVLAPWLSEKGAKGPPVPDILRD